MPIDIATVKTSRYENMNRTYNLFICSNRIFFIKTSLMPPQKNKIQLKNAVFIINQFIRTVNNFFKVVLSKQRRFIHYFRINGPIRSIRFVQIPPE